MGMVKNKSYNWVTPIYAKCFNWNKKPGLFLSDLTENSHNQRKCMLQFVISLS